MTTKKKKTQAKESPPKDQKEQNEQKKPKEQKSEASVSTGNTLYTIGKVVFILVLAFSLIFTAYHVAFAQKIIPGVTVAGVDIGGMTRQEAFEVLSNVQPDPTDQIFFTYNNQTYSISLSELELEYYWDATVKKAYEIGRTGNYIQDNSNKIFGFVTPINSKAYYTFNETAFDTFLASISDNINQSSVDASFALEEDEVIVTPSTVGKGADRDALYNQLVSAMDEMNFGVFEIAVTVTQPFVTEDDLEPLVSQVSEIANSSIVFVYTEEAEDGAQTAQSLEQTFSPTPQEKIGFLSVRKEGRKAVLELDTIAFEPYLETLGKAVYKAPRGKVTGLEGKRVTGFELTQEGQEIDSEKVVADFENALFGNTDSSTVELAVKKISGPRDAQRYGIYSLLGQGESTYVGSAISRENNLILAAERTDGVLVAPGEIYSFNNSVGEISAATGYDSAYIISNGRTVLGDGGGVCQTSTTLFRAVLDSGLPIVTRHPHAYRVTYYEQDRPVGFDAAIYQPSLDFKFENDTPNYVLVQTAYNREEKKLEFYLYGTPDGREVEITEPIVTGQSPPPEALYQDDPTLPKGTVKQVDFAAWGARAEFSRTVTRNGETLYDDTFTSSYRPWQAVFLVGTAE